MDQFGFGWIPQLPDIRDHRFSAVLPFSALPSSYDLRLKPWMPPIQNQGQLGSCTAFGTSLLYRYLLRKLGFVDEDSSELFVYYEARKLLGTIGSDSGAVIRDAIKVLVNQGVPPESTWPYDISKFTQQPPSAAYTAGLLRQALVYESVAIDHTAIKSAIVQDLPVTFGFTVYTSFQGSQCMGPTGVMPMPQAGERIIGGHCVDFVGYDDVRQWYVVRNQWGMVHDNGYFYMPYAYVNSGLCSDAWIVRSVEGFAPTPPPPPAPTTPQYFRVYGSTYYHGKSHIKQFMTAAEAKAAGYQPHTGCT